MPSKGKKETKKDVVKKQPTSGKIEKSSKKDSKVVPKKGTEKVAKIVEKKTSAPVKSVAKKQDKKSSKSSKSKKVSSSSSESMESESSSSASSSESSSSSSGSSSSGSSSSGSSSSGSGSSSSGSGSSSSGSSGSSSSGSGSSSSSEDVEMTETKKTETVATPAAPAPAPAAAAPAAGATETKVNLGNLVFTITDEDVHKFFKDCGKITKIEWTENDQGRFAGRGFVTFDSAEAAAKAATKNGADLLGRPLRASVVGSYSNAPTCEPSATILLKGLSYDATEDDVTKAFSHITTDFQVRFPQRGGMAFVEFTDIENAKKAFAHATGLKICNREVVPDYSRPRERQERPGFGGQQGGAGGRPPQRAAFSSPKPDSGCTFFVGGLSNNVEESDVHSAFSGCNIANVRWVEKDGVFKGVAFVEFVDTTTADRAYDQVKGGLSIKGRDVRMDWAADSRKKF